MKIVKVYCFGNEFVEEDSLAKQLADELEARLEREGIRCVEFVKCLGPEDLPLEETHLTILDVAKGIDKVVVLEGPEGLDMLKKDACRCISCHDLDLAFHLKLLKETGTLKGIRIIAIPAKGDKNALAVELKRILADMI